MLKGKSVKSGGGAYLVGPAGFKFFGAAPPRKKERRVFSQRFCGVTADASSFPDNSTLRLSTATLGPQVKGVGGKGSDLPLLLGSRRLVAKETLKFCQGRSLYCLSLLLRRDNGLVVQGRK